MASKHQQAMTNFKIDDIDQKILGFLIKNARMPFLEIARECGVSGAAIHQRVKKMETNGIITGSRILVKPRALGLNVCAFMAVSLSKANTYQQVVNDLKKIPAVVECHFVTGEFAMLLKLYCKDHNHLMNVIMNSIQNVPNVVKTQTWVSLDQAIDRQVWVKDFPDETEGTVPPQE